MVALQIVERPGTHLRQTLLRAMRDGDLRTFRAEQRGKKVTHRNPNYPGSMSWDDRHGLIACQIHVPPTKAGQEWKLLGAFIGRLADKYADQVECIHIQFRSDT